LRVHLASGRIETYLWNGQAYVARNNYGYRDSIEKLQNGTVVL